MLKCRCREKIVERVVGKGDMFETSAHTIVISKMGIAEHRQPMVLVVVGQKGEKGFRAAVQRRAPSTTTALPPRGEPCAGRCGPVYGDGSCRSFPVVINSCTLFK